MTGSWARVAGRADWKTVSDSRDKLGESPLWNSATSEFYWVDFFGPIIRRLAPDGTRKDWTLNGVSSIGSLVFGDDGRLIIGVDRGILYFDPRDGSTTPFADPNDGRVDLPYNDAKVDRHGNYWIGNFDANESAPRGVLYVLNRQGRWRIGDSGFVVCNGPTFSPRGDILYFSDSMGRQSIAYDLDPATGSLTGRRLFHRFSEADGLPDGCCVDVEGCVWIALYDGGKVVRLSPKGELLQTVKLPARYITSCCIGGRNLTTLYVTSGVAPDGSEPEGGAAFAIEVEVPGLPEPVFRPFG